MGLFGRKKKVTCVKCRTELDMNEARVVDGQYYCAACDIRRKAAAAQAAKERAAAQAAKEKAAQQAKTAEAVHPAIAAIKKTFDDADLHSNVNHIGNQWELVAGISGKANSYQIKYICKDGGKNDVAVRVFGLASFPKGREQAAYRLLNGLQRKYRYLRFVLDKDNDVNLEYDLPSDSENVGPIGREMLIRIMKMVDEFYPELMRAIWA